MGEGVAGKGHDDFGGDGDAGGLNRHEKDDTEVSAADNCADQDCDDFF